MIADVKKNLLTLENQTILTQGTVGQAISVSLSDEWDGLAVTAVFSAGSTKWDVVVSGDSITIPWELLTEDHRKLYMGLHGALPDGSIVIRTNIVSLGEILPSLSPSGNEPEAPSPVRADQIQALAQEALETAQRLRDDAENGVFDGQDGFSPLASVSRNGHTVTISITDINGTTSVELQESESSPSVSGSVDNSLSQESTNPVQNRVIKAALDEKISAPTSPTSGQFLVYDGSAWAAMTLATWQGGNY